MKATAITAQSTAIARAGLYMATFMAVFDIAVVYLALPSMERSIGAGIADQQWIASAYGLMEAGFTLAAGTLGDLYGRKRVYVFGLTLFVLASIGSGLAPTPMFLIATRFLQGIGGAIAMALPLALLIGMAGSAKATEASIRTYATIAGLGAVTAPALGGLLVNTLGWRSIFFVNVPIGAFVVYAALRHTAESPRDPSKRLDVAGHFSSALGLIAFSFAAIEGNVLGWASPPIVGAFALSAVGVLVFTAAERRAATPMIRFALLREPLLAAGVSNMLASNIGFFTMYLIASLFLQNVLRLDAMTAGWYLLANNVVFFATNQFSAPLAARFGPRAVALAGMAVATLGLAAFALFDERTPALLVTLPLALCGIGLGLSYAPLNTLAMRLVPASETGMASGLLNLGRPLGAVFGTAVFGSVIAAKMTSHLLARLADLHANAGSAAAISRTLHHSGVWSLPGTAPKYGLPLGSLKSSIDAGFIAGMHAAALGAAALSALGFFVALRAYRKSTPAVPSGVPLEQRA